MPVRNMKLQLGHKYSADTFDGDAEEDKKCSSSQYTLQNDQV